MRKTYTRGLAILLALAMVVGDFLPAAAAEPSEVVETVDVTEEATEAEDNVEDMEVPEVNEDNQSAQETEEAETSVPEDTELTEPEVVTEEVLDSAEAEQYAGSAADTLVLDVEVELEAGGTSTYQYTPAKSGYYGCESDDDFGWYITDLDWNGETSMSIPTEDGTSTVDAYYLNAGETYQVVVYTYEEENVSFVFHKYAAVTVETLSWEKSVTLEAGSAGIYELSVNEGQKFYVGITGDCWIDYSGDVWCSSQFNMDSTEWSVYESYQGGKLYLTVYCVTETTTLKATKTSPLTYETLKSWSGMITLNPGQTRYFSYTGKQGGDYLFKMQEDLSFHALETSDYVGTIYDSTINGTAYSGYSIEYADNGSSTFGFSLTNEGETTLTVTLYTEADMPKTPVTAGESVDVRVADGKIQYFTFTTTEFNEYEITTDAYVQWILDEDRNYVSTGHWVPEAGKSYTIALHYIYEDTDLSISGIAKNISGTSVFLDPWTAYLFTPSKDGTYGMSGNTSWVEMYNEGTKSWEELEYNTALGAYAAELEAGKTYLLYGGSSDYENMEMSRVNAVTVLDYDYYNAYLASGGSVSLEEDGSLSVLTGTAKWALKQAAILAVGTSSYQAGNLYWKNSKVGAFAPSEFYKVVEAGTGTAGENDTLQPIENGEIQDGDTVVVRYMPEYVWATSLTVRAEHAQTTMETGDTLQLYATAAYGQDKYKPEDVGKETEITWYSSDPDVAEVDYETGEVTAKGAGEVTITAYADMDAKALEKLNNPKLKFTEVKATIKLLVCEKPELTGIEIELAGAEKNEDGVPVLKVVLPYNEEKETWDSVAVNPIVKATPSSYILDEAYLTWGGTVTRADGYCVFDASYMDSVCEITASYWDSVTGEYKEASALVEVEGEPAPVLARDMVFPYYSNLQESVQFGEVEYEIKNTLLVDDSVTGEVIFKTSKGKKVDGSNYLSTLVGSKKNTEITAQFWEENSDGESVLRDTTTFTLIYDDIKLAGVVIQEGLNTLAASEGLEYGISATGYPLSVNLDPVLSYNGVEWSSSEWPDGMDVTLTGTPKNAKVLSVSNEGLTDSALRVFGEAAGKTDLKVDAVLTWEFAEGRSKSVSIGSKTLKFTVAGARAVKTIAMNSTLFGSLADGESYYYAAKNAETAAEEDAFTVCAWDYADVEFDPIKDAKLVWTTTNKKVAYVSTNKTTGDATLVIPKGASGVADITVTANDAIKTSFTFKVVVYDTGVRMDATSVTMNSYSYDAAILNIYPNLLNSSIYSVDVAVRPVKAVKENGLTTYVDDERFEQGGYDKYNGIYELKFANANQAKGSTKVILEIVQTVSGTKLEPEYKTVTVKNVPSVPKAAAKVTANYNKFWKDASATVVVTAGEWIGGSHNITLDNEYLEIDYSSSETMPLNEEQTQWQLKLVAKSGVAPESIKATTLKFTVSYDAYRKETSCSAKLKVEEKAPVYTVEGMENNLSFYPELGDREVRVRLNVAGDIAAEIWSDWNYSEEKEKLQLTASAAKLFEITGVDLLYAEDGGTIEALAVTLRTLSENSIKAGKTGTAAFTFTSELFTKAVTTSGAKISAKKVSTVKTSLVNVVTGSKATAYTFQQQQANSESLTVTPVVSDERLASYTAFAAADKATTAAMKAGNLIVKRQVDGDGNETFLVKATPELYLTKGLSKCKVKFTSYVSLDGESGETIALSAVTLTISLKKQTKAAAVTGTAKVSGSLNVVNPDSTVVLTPTFKNLPVGTEIFAVDFVSQADDELYTFVETDLASGKLVIGKEEGAILPIGKDTAEILYRYRQTDGKYGTVTVKATINVVQTAAVKANTKTITLYNAAIGEWYGKTAVLSVSKAGDAKIRDIAVEGLDRSGISYTLLDENEVDVTSSGEAPKMVTFYVDSAQARGVEKSYKVKLIVTLEGAGTKKGNVVTYSVPVTVTLKK